MGLYIASGGECFVCGVVIKSLGVPSVHDGTPKRVVCLSKQWHWLVRSLVSEEEIHSMTFLMFPSILIHRYSFCKTVL